MEAEPRAAMKTLKYRIKDRRAAKYLTQQATACNQVWNWCAAQHRDAIARYRAGWPKRRWLSFFELSKLCRGLGPELGIYQHTIDIICQRWVQDRSIRFRSSFGTKRARGWVPFHPNDRKITGNAITLRGRTYRVFGTKRRPIPANVKGGYFTEDSLGRWWVCFHIETTTAPATNGEVGIDLGLKDFATLSTGEKVEAPRLYRRLEGKLATAQRANNTRRAKAISAQIANTRRDFHHKLSTRLSRSYAFIAVGDVSPKALAQTRMAKSIYDAGWSSFRRMLAYKAARFVHWNPCEDAETGLLADWRPLSALSTKDMAVSEADTACGVARGAANG